MEAKQTSLIEKQLEDLKQEILSDLNGRRTKFRDFAHVVGELFGVLPDEARDRLFVTDAGSHRVVHAEGVDQTETVALTHGSKDSTLPTWQVRLAITNLADLLKFTIEAATQ